MKKPTLFLFLFLLVLVAGAQTERVQNIRGTVVDKQSQEPLTGVNVIIPGTQPLIGTTTDANGNFRIEKITPGRYSVQASFVGYNQATLSNLLVVSGKELVLKIELEETVMVMDEVVVKAFQHKDKPLNEMAQVSARSFSVEETERYAGTWSDPARMVASYAGVMAVADQRNDIVIRGNSPSGLLWKLEGVSIPNPNHFGTLGTTGGPVSILNNNLLTNSDFYTGAFPAEYGNALSGVFDLKMRNGNNEKREYVAQIGLNGFEFGMEGPFSRESEMGVKASYLVNYRYSTLKILDALGIRFGVSAIPQYQDISFRVHVPGSSWGTFSLFGIGGKSYIELYQSKQKQSDWTFGYSGIDVRYGSDMGAVGLSHLYFFGNDSRLRTTFAVSGIKAATRADSAYVGKPAKNYFGDDSYEVIYSLNSHFWKKFNARGNMSAGISADWYRIHYVDSIYSKRFGKIVKLTDAVGKNMALIQGFFQLKHRFTDRISFSGGIHSQCFTLNGSFALEPRASLSWNFASGQTLATGLGMHSQLQPRLFYFLRSYTEQSTSYLTNRRLGFSKSNQAVISYDYNFAPDWRLKAETYYQHLYRIPVERLPSWFSMINYGTEFYGHRVDSLVNSGTGKNYGLEVTLEKFLSDSYYLLMTASLFNSTYRGSDGIERNTIYNGNFVLNLLGGYSFKIGDYNSLSIDMKTVRAGGKRFIPVDLYASKLAGEAVYRYDEAYNDRFPDYFRLDGRLTMKFNFRKASTEIAFDIQNITNRKNIFLETYDTRSGSLRYDYHLSTFYLILWRLLF